MADTSYQVLARRWRPRTFDEVVGQDAIVQTLRNALDQRRIAHAYCFTGIRGVGKTTVARLLAKGLNCGGFDAPTPTPCGDCASCIEIDGSRSLDVVELDAASQTGVENIRELTEFTRYATSRDRYRVFIIDEAHMLSTSAFNALLKTLEEPPPHVLFVLATTEASKILPTVLSRCQQYPFSRISHREIAGHLRKIADAELIAISDDSLALLATAADGSLRDGQSLLDKVIAFGGDEVDEHTVVDLLGTVDRLLLFRATELVGTGDLPGLLALVNEMVETGVDLHQFTLDLLGHFRNLMVVRTVESAGDILHLPDADVTRLRGQATSSTLEDLDRAFNVLASSEYRIKNADQPRYHIEMVLVRLAQMPHLLPLQELIAELRSSTAETGGSRPAGSSGGGSPSGPSEQSNQKAPAPSDTALSPELAPTKLTPLVGPPAAPDTAASVTMAAKIEPLEARGMPAGAQPDTIDAAASALDQLCQHLRGNRPIIAGILDRATAVAIEGKTLRLGFREDDGIFAARLRDRAILADLESACDNVFGKRLRIQVVTTTLVEATAGQVNAQGNGDASASDSGLTTTSSTALDAVPSPPRGRPTADSEDEDPDGKPADSGLLQRAENEPTVQEFLRALKGRITEVEEL